MKAVFIDLEHNSHQSLYAQLFAYLRDSIIEGDIKAGERLPSLRDLAKQLSVSITTCARAYDQLVLEGYVEAKPQSGYYVQALDTDVALQARDKVYGASYGKASETVHGKAYGNASETVHGNVHGNASETVHGNVYDNVYGMVRGSASGPLGGSAKGLSYDTATSKVSDATKSKTHGTGSDESAAANTAAATTGKAYDAANTAAAVNDKAGDAEQYWYDPESFDFNKWKKCFTWVMNNTPEALLTAQDPQGEPELRKEIADYLYSSRGVAADPDDIVISAGVQQLTGRLARMLRQIGIDCVNVEDPGYKPVRHIFRDHDFMINKIPVAADGLTIENLPTNLATACYVSPSNQFPTGSVMPVSRRYRLLDWATQNGSIIIEDDYDSELRYFGSPVPALKGIDRSGCVVYLGSFSSTLFPAIRISYMILPARLSELYAASSGDYDQTCSKIEQLVLAEYMRNGFYSIGIRKLRKLYARKLEAVTKAFREYGNGLVEAEDTMSGINIRLTVKSSKSAEDLCGEARSLKLNMAPMEIGSKASPDDSQHLIFYYNQIPLYEIDPAVKDICNIWNKR